MPTRHICIVPTSTAPTWCSSMRPARFRQGVRLAPGGRGARGCPADPGRWPRPRQRRRRRHGGRTVGGRRVVGSRGELPAAKTRPRCDDSSPTLAPQPRPPTSAPTSSPTTGPTNDTIGRRIAMTDTAHPSKVDPDSLMTEPSESGRFGEFGGRFVPETLVPACQELEAGFRRAWADPAFRAELDTILRDYAGRPSMLTECFRLGEQLGVPGAAQARGPQPHRLAQDQQRARPGAAGQADGQDPAGRRDRRRPARRGVGHRGGADGARVQGVHGCRRRRAAGAQRVPDAAARRRGRIGAQRFRDAQGRRQRGDARLGRHRRSHATTASVR